LRRINYAWIILAIGFTVLFFSSGSRFAFGLILKPMSEDLELSRSALSLAATCFMIVGAVTMPFVGRLVDSFSVRKVVSIAVIIASVGIGFMGLAQTQWQVILLYGIIFAIGNGGSSVGPIGVMISRWFERGRGAATSAAMSGNALGQLVIITALASTLSLIGWRNAYMTLGIVNLLIVVPLVIAFARSNPKTPSPLMEKEPAPSEYRGRDGDGNPVRGEPVEPPAPSPETAILPAKTIFTSRQLWLLLVIYAICGFQDFFVATHVVAFAQDKGLTAAFSGTLYAFMGLLGLFGVMSAGILADRFSSIHPTALCFLARIICFALIIFTQSTPAIVVFALLYGFTFLITAPLTVTFAGSMFGAPRLGMMSGIINMVHHIAGGLGALIGGIVFDVRGSYDAAFALMLALAVLASALTFLVRERPIASISPSPSRGRW
jgi:predicted MFS family arabinose efflux permease